jgi:hypothetical protein
MSRAFAVDLPLMLGERDLDAVETKLHHHQASVQSAFDRLTAP